MDSGLQNPTVAALGRAARNSTIKTDHLSKDGKTPGPLRVHWIIAVISVTTERNALQGKTWLQSLARCSLPAAPRMSARLPEFSEGSSAVSSADWGKNHKNIFHMQAAVNKPVKYLQACQGICNGDRTVAFECKRFCLGRQSSKVDAGAGASLRAAQRPAGHTALAWARNKGLCIMACREHREFCSSANSLPNWDLACERNCKRSWSCAQDRQVGASKKCQALRGSGLLTVPP